MNTLLLTSTRSPTRLHNTLLISVHPCAVWNLGKHKQKHTKQYIFLHLNC